MNENHDYVNPSASSPPPSFPPEPDVPVTWRDHAAPFLALALAILFWRVFGLNNLYGYGPGLGIPVFVLAYHAAVLCMLGLRRDRWGVFYTAVSVCLALCCTLYCHSGFMIINCFIILFTAAAAAFRFSGQAASAPLTLTNVGETIKLSFFALFSRIAPPWRKLRFKNADREKALRIAAAALVSVVLLAVVLALLASADMVFGSFFTDIAERLEQLKLGSAVWHTLRTAVLTLFILSALYYIRTEAPEAQKARPVREKRVLLILMPAAALDIVYVLFCAIQLRYLFGGAEAAAMAGGWAEYARTGFFQLVAVAVINLTLCAVGSDETRFSQKGGPVLRILLAAMLALTAVILLSAARRMQLYILAYGMSVLRLVTLWGMLIAALGILGAGWKLYRPRFALFPALFGVMLSTWCILCLLNPAGMAGRYNVTAYLDGRLQEVDVDYLRELTPDADGALVLLENSSDRYDRDIRDARHEWSSMSSESWTLWKADLHK